MTLNVLHVTECYDGGVFTSINGLATATPEFRHHLLYKGRGQPSPTIFAWCRRTTGVSSIGKIRAIREIVKSEKIDVVHAHSSFAGVLCRVAGTKVPIIYQPHGVSYARIDFNRKRRRIYFFVEWILARLTSLFIAVSPAEAANLALLGSKAKVALVPNTSTLSECYSADRIAPECPPVVVMCGRIVDVKDPLLFCQISTMARDSQLAIKFVWAGDGDPILRRELEKSGVEVTGWLDKNQLRQVLDSATIYCHTSASEGFPIAVLDAAFCGLPILVRSIDAFSGSGLQEYLNASQAVELILLAVKDGKYRSRLIQQSQALNQAHSPQSSTRAYRNAIEVATKNE